MLMVRLTVFFITSYTPVHSCETAAR